MRLKRIGGRVYMKMRLVLFWLLLLRGCSASQDVELTEDPEAGSTEEAAEVPRIKPTTRQC